MQRGVGAFRARVRWNQDVADIALSLGLAAFALLVAGPRNMPRIPTASPAGPLTPVSAVLILAQTLPLAVRRRYPVPVLIVTGVSIGLYSAFGYAESGGNYGVLVALYTVAANSTRRTAALAAVLTSLGILLTFENYMQHDPHVAGQLLLVYTEYAVAWVVGTYLQGHRQDVRALQERAARLEREREERA